MSDNSPGVTEFVTEPVSGFVHDGPVHSNVRIVALSAKCISVHEAPGPGMAVVYAGVSHQTGKVYVGKKCHGKDGRGAIKRITCHASGIVDRRCPAVARACTKYRFSWFVIDYCTEDEVAEREAWWIKTHDTVVPNGYNLDDGGTSGTFHPQTIEKMKATWEDPVKRQMRIESMQRGHATEAAKANRLASQKRQRLALEEKREQLVAAVASEAEQKALMQKFKECDSTVALRQRRKCGEVIPTPSERKQERLRIKAEGKAVRRLLQTQRLMETCAKKREARLASCSPQEAEKIQKNRRSNENRYNGISTKAEALIARRQQTIARREERANTMPESEQASFWKRCAKIDRANAARKQKKAPMASV